MSDTTSTLEASNAALRNAVETRLSGGTTVEMSPMVASLTGCKPALEAATAALNGGCCEGAKTRCHEDLSTYSEWTPPDYARREEAVAGFRRVVEEARLGRLERHTEPTIARETLMDAIAAVDDRHRKYGPPTEHFERTASLVNAAFGTTFTAADWALVMVLDKIARQRGPGATDDAAIDIAGYAACHQECRRA